MAGPGDEIAVAGGQSGDDLRASYADREQVIGAVKVAFVQGRLTADELDARVGQVYGWARRPPRGPVLNWPRLPRTSPSARWILRRGRRRLGTSGSVSA